MSVAGLLPRPKLLSFRSFSTFAQPLTNPYDYTNLLQQCTNPQTLKHLHAHIITNGHQQNNFVAAKLVSQYVDHTDSNMRDARKVFDCVPERERDVLLWNVIIRGYANLGPFREALSVYQQMKLNGVQGNKYTYPFLLKACAAVGVGLEGRVVHADVVKVGLECDLFVGNSLLSFYGKCREIELSRRLFDEMLVKDIVSWNSMIAGYTQNHRPGEAIEIFHRMLWEVAPDHATVVGVLSACAQGSAVEKGMWIHCYVVKSGMKVDATLGSALIAMYGSCGRLGIAGDVFFRLQERNIVVWDAMIKCYGVNGHAEQALQMFSEMVDCGIQPDGISFVSVLSACSHGGFVDKGWELFRKMDEYGVEIREEHYACMVDLLGRAGQLDEAVKLIKSMPLKKGKHVYGALLGACRIHNNLDLAEEVAERLFVLDPNNAGRYVLLAKMYEDVGRLSDAARVRKAMVEKQIRKQFGCSAIEVDCVLHTFGVDDESHPLKGKIFDTLAQLETAMDASINE